MQRRDRGADCVHTSVYWRVHKRAVKRSPFRTDSRTCGSIQTMLKNVQVCSWKVVDFDGHIYFLHVSNFPKQTSSPEQRRERERWRVAALSALVWDVCVETDLRGALHSCWRKRVVTLVKWLRMSEGGAMERIPALDYILKGLTLLTFIVDKAQKCCVVMMGCTFLLLLLWDA